ncbi:MAG TPA: sodium:solute symporter, partial [Paraburkholderia sp.]|nr:sodium:solute symporter [Paraburkholderia sp.]
WMAVSLKLASSIYTIHLGGLAIPGYAAVWSVIVNLVVAVVVSLLLRVFGMARSEDRTRPEDYMDAIES